MLFTVDVCCTRECPPATVDQIAKEKMNAEYVTNNTTICM